jgi:dihydroorotase-like cyclic amidohydrolase
VFALESGVSNPCTSERRSVRPQAKPENRTMERAPAGEPSPAECPFFLPRQGPRGQRGSVNILNLPGLIDVHVHLREPGGEHKEDMSSGSAAALAGGVTLVLDMPNTSPPIVDQQTLALKQRLAGRQALCDMGFYIGATEGNAPGAASLAGQAVGLKIYLDQTYGPLRMGNLAALLSHFRTWPAGRPIAVHAEGLSVAMAIGLARSFRRQLHLCHVSRADEIALIRAAKRSGAALTCEVTPHHLFLTKDDGRRLGAYGAMQPPLATAADVAALWANLEVIDCIATDHAPHTRTEKEAEFPPPGVPGLETMLPLLLTAVTEGRLTLERLVQLTHEAPRRVFALPAQPNTHVEVDADTRFTLGNEGLYTKCGWTPFEGMRVQGRVLRVILRGRVVYDEGRILARPGDGKVIEPAENRK